MGIKYIIVLPVREQTEKRAYALVVYDDGSQAYISKSELNELLRRHKRVKVIV